MLTLVTGVPGAGKTLNTIKEVLRLQEEHAKENNGELRPVYFYNIPGVKIDDWVQLTEDEVKHWNDLPPGSLLVVDEAQAIFPQRGPKEKVPAHIEPLNTHRHKGFDIFVITQYPKMIDVAVRRLVGTHLHYDRRFGAKTVNRYMWNRVEEEPNDQWKKKEAVRESVKFDPKIYDLYSSAEIHTHKRRFPPKLVIAGAFIVSIPFLAWWGISSVRLPELDQTVAMVGSEVAPGGSENMTSRPDPVASKQIQVEYMYTPRVTGFPHTAPIYDEVTKPVTYPRYNCIMPAGRPRDCRCYSQQATLLDTTVAVCMSIIERGLFDPARPDAEPAVYRPPPRGHSGDLSRGPGGASQRSILLKSGSAEG